MPDIAIGQTQKNVVPSLLVQLLKVVKQLAQKRTITVNLMVLFIPMKNAKLGQVMAMTQIL
jgi:hypothetical protein